jgi:AcrR family transcriptional regulator
MVVTISSQGDGRTRKRIEAMRRVQAAALDLFEARGFDAVSIEEIARAADLGPATIYRNFGTKERIVSWDEYDPMLLDALACELDRRAPIEAMARALDASLAQVYQRDRARILRRARLVRATPPLRRAAEADLRDLRTALAGIFAPRCRDVLEARVLAGAVVAALEAGIDHWLDGKGRAPLSRSFSLAFARLRRLGA